MNDITLKFRHILLGSAALIALAVPQTYAAEENAEDDAAPDDDIMLMEEIVATGIRGSQMRALQAKRFSDGIMDGIAAEDMGKFPDQNISEALQRIPGVTIDRVGGEGRRVTVRGMGPEFNTVLLNGRVLATENEGRDFSFDILAAELISAAEVYKTPTARMVEGGIGATINMKTARPLDKEGFHGAISAKGLYDTSRGSVSPQASGFLSQTFNDGKFGILGSFSYNKRKFRNERVFTAAFSPNESFDFDNDGTPEHEDVFFVNFAEFDVNEATRERISGTLALQMQATDDLRLTLDGLYSKLDVNDQANVLFFFGGAGDVTEATVDENGTVTRYKGNTTVNTTTFSRPRFGETRQIGFNADWQANDNLTAVFDTAYSKSTDKNGGNQAWFETGLDVIDPTEVIIEVSPEGLPILSNFTPSGTTLGKFQTFEGRKITDETFQATFDLDYAFDDAGPLVSVQAGANYAFRQKIKDVVKTPDNLQNIFRDQVVIPQSLFFEVDTDGFLGGNSLDTNFPGHTIADLEAFYLSDAAIDQTNDPDATRAAIAANGGGFAATPRPGEGGTVTENNYGAFVQANFEGAVGDMPWSGNMGLRYTQTSVSSAGFDAVLLGLGPTPGDPFTLAGNFSEPMTITESGTYHVWLPSANFKLEPYEDIVFRAAVGKTLTRATLSDLSPAKSFDLQLPGLNVNSGNPSLQPMIAWNYDANLTWYIDDASYLSIAWFHKDLSGKSRNTTTEIKLFGEDFLLHRPENVGSGSIDGVEVSVQYTFNSLPEPFDGLGVQANYTNVKQKTDSVTLIDFDDTGAPVLVQSKTLDEDSETYNVVAFYEKGPIQARIAYNYRATYLESLDAARGQPQHVRAYGQWDASASYDVTDDITVFVEAINITNAQTLKFSIFENRIVELADTGSRYTFGARWNF